MKKSDRTRKKIIDTFYALNECQTGKLCTVSEICAKMDISVSTFYCHFSGIREILELESDSLMRYISEAAGQIQEPEQLSTGGFTMTREKMFAIIRLAYSRRRETLLLMRPELDLPFRSYLRALVIEGVNAALIALPSQTRSYVVEFMTAGIMTDMDKWLREQDMSPEEFVDILFSLENTVILTSKKVLSKR